MRVNLLMR